MVEGSPADALADASRSGGQLVPGSHGHTRTRPTVLGSVSQACIRKADCPAVVIPVLHAEQTGDLEPVP